MPQEFQVVQCYRCETFQVHQVKKVLKWNCKLCGEKQSVKKVYGCGSGVDCRKHVQQLNTMRGEIASLREASTSAFPRNDHDEERGQMCEDVYADPHQENMTHSSSKWGQYTEEKEETVVSDEEDSPQITTDRHYFTNQRKAARKRKMAENKAGAAKYSRWENRADGNDSDPGKTDYGTASRGTVQRFSLPQPDKPSKGLFAKSQQLNREPLYVEKETRYRNNVASLPEHFGGPVYSSSKWGHYIQTEKYNQYQDVSDYGMYEQDGTGSDLLTGDKFYIDNKTNDKNVPSLEREYQTKFGYENDNVEDVYWNTIQYSKKKTEAVTSISLRNEQNQISENSSRQKLALDADNIGSKWSKFMIEEHDHVSDEDDNDDTIYTSESCQAYDSMDKIHHPLTELDRNKIHFPLRELDRNQVKRDTTASEEGVRHTDFPSKLFTKTNFSSSESKHTKLTLQPKGNVANCLQEARSLFTVGELSDDDLNL